ncbi:MAG: hypothetical protein A3A80_04030 [Candidatus Terrybacteria bacterium RIFCSPLOWO2_01_FULL_44_24]|uniref:Prepilin peptidase n=1 Tax=Candidatus Terrybacteria bacterium RIFCSPHIGHO2_01_FULL_43_35 TaxID=1802361 RepID=A0A1G2PG89_9BACT|nr:MAG: hypothetical protein A2828_02955 [Candidatus Terrybacteria bacterium RIFCSPHIGHO2_01_FULL_43_35]OHA50178.1 MAG: hypothetical protein A3B75_01615 [Candidatus Terrybacteria bacterium RIFCSPHIGHO2_02_FULL_43_14]OHA51237.1 MAG: hypothetical protein A3A80_04030 [Candidatus Terrybacteria bacterium RIFCSPLOWO2_01_FULL_44_24]
MYAFTAIFCFIFGTICGSFIDTVAERWGQDKSIMGRSRCVDCGKILRWRELIPIFSFLALHGKCSACGIKIPKRHLFTETLTGLAFAVLFLSLPTSKYIYLLDFKNEAAFFINLLFLWLVSGVILVILFSDARFFVIPDLASIPSAFFILSYSFFLDFVAPKIALFSFLHTPAFTGSFHVLPSFYESLLGALVAALFFFSISFVSKGTWMGWGDGKFALMLGALFGWPFVAAIIFLAFVLGSIVGSILMIKREATMKSLLPFGVFLGASALFFLIFQNTHDGSAFRLFVEGFVSL